MYGRNSKASRPRAAGFAYTQDHCPASPLRWLGKMSRKLRRQPPWRSLGVHHASLCTTSTNSRCAVLVGSRNSSTECTSASRLRRASSRMGDIAADPMPQHPAHSRRAQLLLARSTEIRDTTRGVEAKRIEGATMWTHIAMAAIATAFLAGATAVAYAQ